MIDPIASVEPATFTIRGDAMRNNTIVVMMTMLVAELSGCGAKQSSCSGPSCSGRAEAVIATVSRTPAVGPAAPSASASPAPADIAAHSPFPLHPDSPFSLVARGDRDLSLSVTPVGAFVTYLDCDVLQSGPYARELWRKPLHIRRAQGGVWLGDKLSQTPVPEWLHFGSTVEARSPEDIWVTRSAPSGPNGYFHWNGSDWEQIPKRTTPAGHELYAAGLFDWQGTKLIPYLPAPGAIYRQGVLPLFSAWDGTPPPSFARMSATAPRCQEQEYDNLRYNFATLPAGDVFVVEHPCDLGGEGTMPRVGHWLNGRVTVARVPGYLLQVTAGRVGSDDTALLWGKIDDAEPILYRWQREQWVRVNLPPVVTAAKGQHRFVGRVEFDGAGAAWIIFSGHFSIWRYDGHWKEYAPPEADYQQLSMMHGDLRAVSASGQRVYRLRDGRWYELPFFRDEQWAVGVTGHHISPDDIWIEVFVRNTREILIYRNRPMPLLAPCQRQRQNGD